MGWQDDPVVKKKAAWENDPVVTQQPQKNNLKASVYAGLTDLAGGPGDMVTSVLKSSNLLGKAIRAGAGFQPAPSLAPDSYPSEALRQGAGMVGIDANPDANYWQQWPIRFGISSISPGGWREGLKQVAGGFASGGTFALAKELFPENQTVQTLAAMGPQIAAAGAAGSVRGVARGGEAGRQEMAANLERTKAVMGEEGPLSSVLPTNGRREVAGWLEKAASYLPAAGFPVRAKGERLQSGMGQTLADASNNGTGDLYSGGEAIREGLTGKGGWVDRFETTGNKNYNKVFSHFSPTDTLDPSNFRNTLRELAGKFSTEKMNEVFGDPRYVKWAEAVDPSSVPPIVNGTKTVAVPGKTDPLSLSGPAPQQDIPVPNVLSPGRPRSLDPLTGEPLPAQMSFADAKGIRTRLGTLLSKPELVSGFDTAEIERLYGALSEDLSKYAWQKGGTAWADWKNATDHWNKGRNDIRNFIEPLQNLPQEKLFETIMSPKDGYTRILKIKEMIGNDKWDTAAETLAARMGTPAAGKDLFGNEVPDKFSSETFLTNYNRMPDKNKGAIFGYGERRKALDSIARASSDLRKTSQSLANPSGTAGAGLAGLLLKQAAAAAVTFAVTDLGTLGATTALSYAAAKKLMDPKFARWLAQSTSIPPSALSAHIQRLRLAAQNSGDKEMEAVADELAKLNAQPGQMLPSR